MYLKKDNKNKLQHTLKIITFIFLILIIPNLTYAIINSPHLLYTSSTNAEAAGLTDKCFPDWTDMATENITYNSIEECIINCALQGDASTCSGMICNWGNWLEGGTDIPLNPNKTIYTCTPKGLTISSAELKITGLENIDEAYPENVIIKDAGGTTIKDCGDLNPSEDLTCTVNIKDEMPSIGEIYFTIEADTGGTLKEIYHTTSDDFKDGTNNGLEISFGSVKNNNNNTIGTLTSDKIVNSAKNIQTIKITPNINLNNFDNTYLKIEISLDNGNNWEFINPSDYDETITLTTTNGRQLKYKITIENKNDNSPRLNDIRIQYSYDGGIRLINYNIDIDYIDTNPSNIILSNIKPSNYIITEDIGKDTFQISIEPKDTTDNFEYVIIQCDQTNSHCSQYANCTISPPFYNTGWCYGAPPWNIDDSPFGLNTNNILFWDRTVPIETNNFGYYFDSEFWNNILKIRFKIIDSSGTEKILLPNGDGTLTISWTPPPDNTAPIINSFTYISSPGTVTIRWVTDDKSNYTLYIAGTPYPNSAYTNFHELMVTGLETGALLPVIINASNTQHLMSSTTKNILIDNYNNNIFCCLTQTDCVFNNACYPENWSGDVNENGYDEFCHNSTWYDPDKGYNITLNIDMCLTNNTITQSYMGYSQYFWETTGLIDGNDTYDNNFANGFCCQDDHNETYIGPLNIDTADQTADNTDACCSNPTDCVISNLCFTSDSDTANMIDDGGKSCYNAGLFQGFCGDSTWQTTPDDSPDACCCISNGYWDNANQCCDTGDSWTSSDGKWVCYNGNVLGNDYTGPQCDSTLQPLPKDIIFTSMCDELEVDGIKQWWNNTDWVTTAPQQCGCTQNSDCDTSNSESCIANICVEIKDPILNFIPYTSLTIPLGNTEELILNIKNNMSVTDHIELNIDTNSDISKWAWFKGQKNLDPHTKRIVVAPYSNTKVIIEIMGGKIGSYTLNINSQSLFTLKEASKNANIKIIPKINENTGKVETTTTPGISWFGFILIMMLGSMILYRKDTF